MEPEALAVRAAAETAPESLVEVRFPGERVAHVAAASLLSEAVLLAGLPLARSCGSEGLCGRCGVEVLEGADALAPESSEERAAKARNRIDPKLRLACQVRIVSGLRIDAPYFLRIDAPYW